MVFKMGLRGKSVLVLGSLVLTALLVMAIAIYYQATTLTIQELLEATGNSIDKDVIEIEALVRSSRDDLMVIADTPPIQGIIRARANQGKDPLTGDKTEYWYARLEQIFGAFITNHPEIYQVRYLDAKGDEIVRSTRTGPAVKNTPRPDLQNMARFPCYSETIRLKPNAVYYSEVNLNRENGVLQVPHTPMLRLATPIYDPASAVRGVVVVNLFAEAMFSPVRSAPQGTKKYLVNRDGLFLVHPDRAREYGFDLGFGYGITDEMREYPDVSTLPERFVKYHKTERHVDGNHKIHYDPASLNRYWTLLYEIPESVALRKIYPARNVMLVVGFFIAVISFAAITWIATRKMATPILRLSKVVRKLESGDLAARVREDGLADEIGELASSMNRMAGAIEKNINELGILNRITVAASASLSIEEIARNTLDAILGLELLKVGKKAAIFVADDAARSLRLVASHGFSEEQQALDAVVPYGDCLCGRAAETGETICSEQCCDNPYHTRKYTGITPHGHLIIPFKSREKVLGLLVLYLATGTRLSPEETRIYTSIADVLAVSFQNAAHFEKIEQLKNRHGLILTSLGEGLYGLDTDGICTFMNPAAERMLGYETGELVGTRLHAITHHTRPDGSPYPQEECKIYASFVKNAVYRVDDEVFWKKDGSSFPVEYTGTPIHDESGAAIGAVVVFSDVTERRKMETATRESRERYLSLYEGIDDALLVHGMTADGHPGNFIEVNEIACRLLGYSRDELLAMSPAHIDAPESATDLLPVVARIAAGNSVTFNQTHVAKDGRRIPVEIRSRMFVLQGQNAVISLVRDITDRKRAEEQLEAEKVFSDDLIDSIPGVLFCFTPDGRFLRWNSTLEEILGYSRDAIERLHPLDIIAPEDRARAAASIETVFRLGKAEVELTLLAGGGRVPYQILGHAIQVNNAPALLGVGIDITERKKADAILKEYSSSLENEVAERTKQIEAANTELQAVNVELEVRRAEAETATRAKSDFLANMSHELRTPLNSILGFSESLRDGLAGEVNAQQKEYLTDVWESGSHLLGLINDILDISKIEAGKMVLELGEFDLHVLLGEALVFFREKATRHGISLHREAADDLPSIVADERKIKQVLINLLNNALKFTPDGGNVGVCTTRVGREIQVSVWDTGIGIAPEDRDRLFQPFQQLESPLTKKHEGTGLGLSLSRKIVELHGGRIWVESTPGEGSRFTFAIPISTAAEKTS